MKKNWHSKRYKDKKREIEKRAPRWLYKENKTVTKEMVTSKTKTSVEKLVTSDEFITKGDYRFKLTIETSLPVTLPPIFLHNNPQIDGEYSTDQLLDLLSRVSDEVIPKKYKILLRYYSIRRKTESQYKITRKDYERLRQKLDKEHHWMSGMVRESTGRARLHADLKRTALAYNQVLKYATSEILTDCDVDGVELVTPYICDCPTCIELYGEPTCIDEVFNFDWIAIANLYTAEEVSMDLKGKYDRWEYRY